MRLLTTLAIILALVIAAGFWTNHLFQVSANEITRQIDQTMVDIKNQHWEKAARQTVEIEKRWGKIEKWWPIFIDHQEIDNIEFSLARIKEYVTNQDLSLSLGQLSELRLMVKHIPQNEALTLKNIF